MRVLRVRTCTCTALCTVRVIDLYQTNDASTVDCVLMKRREKMDENIFLFIPNIIGDLFQATTVD